ncbi:MAG: tetratricopeptide repeat protein [Planctomycetota bacterium]|jgi:tetratricopeptide (TPR) repeat protein
MKSDHRHELKTNELAEWLGNLPDWTKQNLGTIILVTVLLGAAAGFYFWRTYNRNVVQSRRHVEFTGLLNQVSGGKMRIVQAQTEGNDQTFMLLQPAKNLETFAQSTKNDRMAALALIKRAEALRAELHYGTVQKDYLISQTNLAKASYAKALDRCPDDPSLAAAAKFGLGLCEEELGNFEQARQIYQQVDANPDFKATGAAVQARRRLATMADYEREVVFRPKPAPPAAAAEPNDAVKVAAGPVIQLSPTDANVPFDVNLLMDAGAPIGVNVPVEVNLPVEANLPAEVNQ